MLELARLIWLEASFQHERQKRAGGNLGFVVSRRRYAQWVWTHLDPTKYQVRAILQAINRVNPAPP